MPFFRIDGCVTISQLWDMLGRLSNPGEKPNIRLKSFKHIPCQTGYPFHANTATVMRDNGGRREECEGHIDSRTEIVSYIAMPRSARLDVSHALQQVIRTRDNLMCILGEVCKEWVVAGAEFEEITHLEGRPGP